jgi:branched-subunit amino acid aminotransferase/4-amino-4-deoxychorismate lyase
MNAWLDGRSITQSALPKRVGTAPFETMGAMGGALPLWERHLARLAATAARLGLPFAPPTSLRAEALELLRANGHDGDVLRLSVLRAADGVHTSMVTRARSPVRVVKLLPTVVARPEGAPPADVKAEPRAYHDAVRQQAQDGGADDGIVLGTDGAVLETALGNLWLLLDGTWVTPPLDGRVLPGIARALLLEHARAANASVRVAERACTLGDVHRAQALAHSNAVHGPRPACLVGERASVAKVDGDLLPLWRRATTG